MNLPPASEPSLPTFTDGLVSVDRSPVSRRAVACAVALCEPLAARLTALAVMPGRSGIVMLDADELVRDEEEAAYGAILHEAALVASAHGVPLRARIVGGRVPEAVLYHAVAGCCDLIGDRCERR